MKNIIRRNVTLILLFMNFFIFSQERSKNRWKITSENAIHFNAQERQNLPYSDNIEMDGKRVAGIVSYAIDSLGTLSIERQVFFPQLHPYIKENDPSWFVYRSYLKHTFTDDILPKLFTNNKRFAPGKLKRIDINGTISFEHLPSENGIILKRQLAPSPSQRLFVEQFTLINTSKKKMSYNTTNTSLQLKDMGTQGTFTTVVTSNIPSNIVLKPGDSVSFSLRIMAKTDQESLPDQTVEDAITQRQIFLDKISSSLVLETPNQTLNTLFEFSKIRASESIYESKLGLIHSPGGGRYYVGIWANDQAEYVNPFFPYLGYDIGNISAMNTYRAFATKTNAEFTKLPYAFEVEGLPPPAPLDRGDAAMIAYGASQYALTSGNKSIAEELWPLISWCLEYCKRQLNTDGVVQSESDEMEGRIETGTANLATSSLYYGALNLTVDLGKSLKKSRKIINAYEHESKEMAKNIETYFGARIEGLDTYKYYKEHNALRHWVCLPLVVGINKRQDATITALFDRLWTDNGVHVEKNNPNRAISTIFWDRGTLYALRGTFLSGATDQSMEKLEQFSNKRLLGNRVPYVVEAYPEGNMAHLSAESGLYCRVFVEGLFGIIPTGLKSFSVLPKLPKKWDHMALRKIKAFGENFDIEIRRKGNTTNVKIIDVNGTVLLNKNTTLQKPISFSFNK